MEGVESRAESQGQDSQIMSEISVRREETIEGFQRCVEEILNLIKQDENFSELTAEIYESKMFKLTHMITELSRMHKSTTSIKTHHVGSCNSIPGQKSNTNKFMTPVGYELIFNDGGGFYISRRDGSESSITSSSDSKSESFMSINKQLNSPVKNDASKGKGTKVRDNHVLLNKISTLEKEVNNLMKKNKDLTDENAILEAGKANVAELKVENSEYKLRIETMQNVIEGSRKQVLKANEEVTKVKQDMCSKMYDKTNELHKQLDSQQAKILELQEKLSLAVAEIFKRDDAITKLNADINLLKMSHAAVEDEWNSDIKRLKNELSEKCGLVDELKLKVVELEKVTSDIAEEKREAIRQLSFSLEHYMSGYNELRQTFVDNKRRAD